MECRAGVGDADVVEQDVEASVGDDRRVDEPLPVGGLPHVVGDRGPGAEFADECVETLDAAGAEHEVCAGGVQAAGELVTEAGGGPGDHGHAIA